MSKTAASETWRNHLSTDIVYKFAYFMKMQPKGTSDWIENGYILLMFVKSTLICGYCVPTLQYNGWKVNNVVPKEEPLGESYGPRIFASACFGPTKKARFGVVMLMGEEEEVAVVWFAKAVLLLRVRSGRGGEKMEIVFLQHREVAAPLDAVEKNLDSICVRCSTSD